MSIKSVLLGLVILRSCSGLLNHPKTSRHNRRSGSSPRSECGNNSLSVMSFAIDTSRISGTISSLKSMKSTRYSSRQRGLTTSSSLRKQCCLAFTHQERTLTRLKTSKSSVPSHLSRTSTLTRGRARWETRHYRTRQPSSRSKWKASATTTCSA